MRWLFAPIILLVAQSGMSQRIILTGRVTDKSQTPIVGAHIRNTSIDKITTSGFMGEFNLPARPGDTLYITSIGFTSVTHILAIGDFTRLSLQMTESITSLNEVTIYSLPPIEVFKKTIMETQVKDSVAFWYFGVAKPVFRGDKMREGQIHKKALYGILQPTNFLYYNLSKQEKEKRKFYQLQQNQSKVENANNKFTREWVAEQTGLEGDKLTSFIAFCNFSTDYLDRFPLYVIREDMMVKLEEFKKNYGE